MTRLEILEMLLKAEQRRQPYFLADITGCDGGMFTGKINGIDTKNGVWTNGDRYQMSDLSNPRLSPIKEYTILEVAEIWDREPRRRFRAKSETVYEFPKLWRTEPLMVQVYLDDLRGAFIEVFD